MPPAAALKGLFAGGLGVATKTKALVAAKGLLAAGAGAMGFTTYKKTSENLQHMQSKLETLEAQLENTKAEQQETVRAQTATIITAVVLTSGGAALYYVYRQGGDLSTVMTASRDSWTNLKHAIDEGIRRMYGLSGPHSKPGRLSSKPHHHQHQHGNYIIASAGTNVHVPEGNFRPASL